MGERTGLAALILAGGASSRMGADKAALDWAGVRAVDRVAAAAAAAGAATVLTVGPRDYGYPHVVEQPAGGGAAAGILQGARRLASTGAQRALVLAVDAPLIRAEDVAPLLAAPRPGAAYARLNLPLVLDLEPLPDADGSGWPIIRLIEALGLVWIEPPPGAEARLRGANTPSERDVLLAAWADEPEAHRGAD